MCILVRATGNWHQIVEFDVRVATAQAYAEPSRSAIQPFRISSDQEPADHAPVAAPFQTLRLRDAVAD